MRVSKRPILIMIAGRIVPLFLFLWLQTVWGAAPQESPPLEKARKLLSDAGFPKGAGFPRISILYNTSESHKRIAMAIGKMWKDGLGIEAEPVNAEWKVYLDKLSQVQYQVARRGWIPDYPDPASFLGIMASSSGNNNTGWKSRQYDLLLARAKRESISSKRMKVLYQAEEILLDEAPIVPIYYYVAHSLYDPDEVKGLYQNALGVHPLNGVVKGDGTGVLVMDNYADVLTLDPAASRGVPERNVEMALFEGLLKVDPRTCRSIPGVAEGYEISGDGKTYTFHLRDCTWSDGRAVQAQDFVYSWKRLLDPKLAADYAYLLHGVKGAEGYNRGRAGADDVAIKATDAKTLVIELVEPSPTFPYAVSMMSLFPVREDVVKRHGRKWTRPENIIVNGPFALKEWVPEEHILVERNEKYWDSRTVKQRRVKFIPIEHRDRAFRMYEGGELDYLGSLPPDRGRELSKRPDAHVSTLLATYFYSFNTTEKPFTDKRVRRALSLALDRKLICDMILKGGQKPAHTLVPPVFRDRGYQSPTRRLY